MVNLTLNNWSIKADLNSANDPYLEVKGINDNSTFSLYPKQQEYEGLSGSIKAFNKPILTEYINGKKYTYKSTNEFPYEMHQRMLIDGGTSAPFLNSQTSNP